MPYGFFAVCGMAVILGIIVAWSIRIWREANLIARTAERIAPALLESSVPTGGVV